MFLYGSYKINIIHFLFFCFIFESYTFIDDNYDINCFILLHFPNILDEHLLDAVGHILLAIAAVLIVRVR